jgi:repressor LexA
MQLKTPRPTSQLTPRQLQLLKAIAGYQASRCYSPTIGELAFELGVSRSTAFEHTAELRKKGMLWACPGRARSLKLTSKAQKLFERLTDCNLNFYPELSTETSFGKNAAKQQTTAIPLLGRVAAGSPIEAVEDKDYLSLRSYFAPDDSLFALEVKGDSMVGSDIRHGDYVICRRSSLANDGQLVIAIIDNENTTLKRFYKEKKRVRLQPANDDYEPIYSDNCRIEAVVVGLVRKF